MSAVDVDLGLALFETHAADPTGETHRTAGRDHRLGRDAVPQVGRAADHVAFHHGDLRTESRRIRGRLVAGRAATDDEESHAHVTQATGAWGSSVAMSLPGEQCADTHGRCHGAAIEERPAGRDVRAVRRRVVDLVPPLADPFEVHAVGPTEVAAPCEAVLAEDPHHVAVHLWAASLTIRGRVRVERHPVGVPGQEADLATHPAEPGVVAAAGRVGVRHVDRTRQSGRGDLCQGGPEVGDDRDVALRTDPDRVVQQHPVGRQVRRLPGRVHHDRTIGREGVPRLAERDLGAGRAQRVIRVRGVPARD